MKIEGLRNSLRSIINKIPGYIGKAIKWNVAAVCNRDIKYCGWPATRSAETKPLSLKFSHW
jgi:hypothetical protein